MTKDQRTILCVCVGIFALGQFHRASGGVFTPILMDRFAVSAATIGTLVSAMFFATIIAQLPFGAVLDRVGPRRVLSICILIVAAGTAVFAVGPSFDAAFASRILIGIGLASMGAATHVIIARNFPQSDFGYISGLVVTLGGIGGLLGTYPLAVALDHLPWSGVFGAAAIFAALLATLAFKAIAPGNGQQKQDEAPGGYLALLRKPEFLKILTLGFVTFAPITTITGLWGGPFLQSIAGLSAQQSGAVLLLLFSATIVAGFTFGVLDRKVRSRRAVILSAACISVLGLSTLAALAAPPAVIAITLLALMVFCQQFYIPLGAHMRRCVPDQMLGRASTLLSLVSVAAIPLMQVGFGAVLDVAGGMGLAPADQYRVAFATMAVLILLCTLIYATSRQINDPADTRTT